MHTEELDDDDLDFVIDTNQEWQCQWWSYEFRVAPDELRAAVRHVGSSANAVREHLMPRRSTVPHLHLPAGSHTKTRSSRKAVHRATDEVWEQVDRRAWARVPTRIERASAAGANRPDRARNRLGLRPVGVP